MFTGFSDRTIDFMYGIGLNNERSWFLAHKEEYLTHFQRPMNELAGQVYEALDGRFSDRGLVYKVSRIYRDARRLHGRPPYRDCLWFSIRRPTDSSWDVCPVFWFELTPAQWSYGLGYYSAKASTMAKFRARMDRDPKAMEKLARKLEKQTEFVLEGPEYARRKEAPAPLLDPWYNKKYFSIIHEEPNSDLLYRPDLADRLADGFADLMPFYDYFVTLDSDPDPRH